MPVYRVGEWSSRAVVVIGAAYLIALVAGISRFGLTAPITDPILAVMEVLTVLSAVALTAAITSLAVVAPHERRIFGTLAIVFIGLFAGVTIVVHIVALTAGRQTGAVVLVWPSVLYAAELAAWDVLLGTALLFAAWSVDGAGESRVLRVGLFTAGALCLVGMIGPALGRMPLQRIGIVGYAVVLPVVCVVLARRFGSR